MKKKYLLGPFLCTFAVWTVGNGTLALVPLYAMERGASAAGSGLFMAFAFLCLALGTFASGLLPKRFAHRRMLLVTTGVLWVFLFLLNSRTTTLFAFAAGCGASYFLGGIVFAQAAVLTGLAAPTQERGAAFGILGMTNGLGGLVGGVGSGWLADRFGFVGLWEGAAAAAVLIIVGGLLSVESPVEQPLESLAQPEQPEQPGQPARPAQPAQSGGPSLRSNETTNQAAGIALLLLLGVNLFLAFTNSTANLGRSLVMDQHGFSKLTISLTQSVSGMAGLGLSFTLGWLSDKVGRRWVLVGSCALTGAALLVLGFSRLLWQFYAFAALMAFLSVPTAIGPAYLMDVVPRQSAARGVSFFQGVFWAGNIVGLVALGAAFERLGTVAPILYSALFPAAGIVLLLLIRTRRIPTEASR
jgi:MFS family permease